MSLIYKGYEILGELTVYEVWELDAMGNNVKEKEDLTDTGDWKIWGRKLDGTDSTDNFFVVDEVKAAIDDKIRGRVAVKRA